MFTNDRISEKCTIVNDVFILRLIIMRKYHYYFLRFIRIRRKIVYTCLRKITINNITS